MTRAQVTPRPEGHLQPVQDCTGTTRGFKELFCHSLPFDENHKLYYFLCCIKNVKTDPHWRQHTFTQDYSCTVRNPHNSRALNLAGKTECSCSRPKNPKWQVLQGFAAKVSGLYDISHFKVAAAHASQYFMHSYAYTDAHSNITRRLTCLRKFGSFSWRSSSASRRVPVVAVRGCVLKQIPDLA